MTVLAWTLIFSVLVVTIFSLLGKLFSPTLVKFWTFFESNGQAKIRPCDPLWLGVYISHVFLTLAFSSDSKPPLSEATRGYGIFFGIWLGPTLFYRGKRGSMLLRKGIMICGFMILPALAWFVPMAIDCDMINKRDLDISGRAVR